MILGTSHKWNHTIFVLYVWLFSFNTMFPRFIHIVPFIRMPLLFEAEYHSMIRLHHILFIHSYVDGHLDCFQLLAIVINAARRLASKYLFESLLLILLMNLGVKLMDPMVILCLTF